MVPLYFAKTASFILKTKNMTSTLAEAIVEGTAEIFEEEKDYLIKNWDRAKKEFGKQKQKDLHIISNN